MADAIRRDFPEAVQWTVPEGGLYFWTRLPKSVRTSARSRLFQEALGQNVLYVPGGLCYADDPTRKKPEHEMRISYGHAREGDIREGIKHLGTAIRKILAGKEV
jgi:2-aminoadipate transaminase